MFYVYDRSGIPLIFRYQLEGQESNLIGTSETFEGAQELCDNHILPEEVKNNEKI
jgi:hypothetical protein